MYYKVVRREYNRLFSVFETDIEVEYKIGEFVEPILKGAPLLVFNNLKAARNFANGNDRFKRLEIYECEITKPRPALNYKASVSEYRKVSLISFWQEIFALRNKRKKTQIGYNFPEGSTFCNSVKLIKVVV